MSGLGINLDKQGFAICPFNSNHRVKPTGLLNHIAKCAKNEKHRNFRECPFTAFHQVPANEYEEHVKNCPCADTCEDDKRAQ